MDISLKAPVNLWRSGQWMWLAGAVVVGLFLVIFYDAFGELIHHWNTRGEYSHGFLIPVISLFLVWQQKNQLAQIDFTGSWWGLVLIGLGAFLAVLGELSTLYIVVQYAFLMTLTGVVLALLGRQGMALVWVALIFLIFMIPLPPFLYNMISGELQLVSSELGVAVIRFFGISVFLEGNVIDLGSYKLQVVEACDGLRYLFPFMSFAFICAYFYRAKLWMRSLIFLSSIPITILMNSFRIGVIGVLVEHWGVGAAEGFVHDFEGWLIFMVCIGILLMEMWLLSWVMGDKRPFHAILNIQFPEPSPANNKDLQLRHFPKPFIASAGVLCLVALVTVSLTKREEVMPSRTAFVNFPMALDTWQSRRTTLAPDILDRLKLTDYILADYQQMGQRVNFYVAYYESQRKGASIHSPKSCLPGSGWKMESLSKHRLDDITTRGEALQVNRVQIQKGEVRQLVYYWFDQRDRTLTNEYLVKWYLFWDSLTKNRSDGALIRLVTSVDTTEDWEAGDRRLESFMESLKQSYLDEYI